MCVVTYPAKLGMFTAPMLYISNAYFKSCNFHPSSVISKEEKRRLTIVTVQRKIRIFSPKITAFLWLTSLGIDAFTSAWIVLIAYRRFIQTTIVAIGVLRSVGSIRKLFIKPINALIFIQASKIVFKVRNNNNI